MGRPLPSFGYYRRIVQSPGSVSISYDLFQGQGWHRVIPVTANPHLPQHVREWRGDSRGHWEGNTLVVDVTNFTSKTEFSGSRENLHLVERWTRLDADTLEYVVTIEDPTTWTSPWTVKQELTRQDEQQNRIYYEPAATRGTSACSGSWPEPAPRSRRSPRVAAPIRPPSAPADVEPGLRGALSSEPRRPSSVA